MSSLWLVVLNLLFSTSGNNAVLYDAYLRASEYFFSIGELEVELLG